jgi:uridine kinase
MTTTKKKAAAPDLMVTISGATGSGKTTLARIICDALARHQLGVHYKFVATGIHAQGQNFPASTDIDRLGDFKTVMIVETEA